MANTNHLVMPYYVSKITNPLSKVANRYFAHVRRQGTLSTRGLADHMLSHGLIANKGELIKTLSMLSECIPELVAQGYGVKLDGLGIFYPSIANEKGGAEKAEDFNAAQHIRGVRFRFTPDSSNLDDLTSTAYGKQCVLEGGWEKVGDNFIRIKAAETPAGE